MNGSNGHSSSKLMWTPNPDVTTNMDEFRQVVNDKYNLQLSKSSNIVYV